MESINSMPVQKSSIGIKHRLRNGIQITVKTLEVGSWIDGPSRLRVHFYNGSNRVVPVDPNSFYLIDRNWYAQTPVGQDINHRFLYPGGSVELLLSFETSYLEISRLAIAEETLDSASTFITDMSQVVNNVIAERKPSSGGLAPWEQDSV